MTDETNLLMAETLQKTQANPKPANGKPDGLPAKFWDAEKQEIRVETLLKSYLLLEKKLAGTVDLPNDEASRKKFLKAAGVPDTSEEYQIDIRDELFEPDPELNKRLHAKGFTSEQVQEVYDLATEKMIPMILDMAAEFQAEREIKRLIEHFGGEEQWREVSRQMLAFGKKNLSAPVLEGLSGSFEGVMALYKMMQSDEPATLGHADPAISGSEKDLQAMMRDPKYWRDRDPAFIARVTEGFRQLYG